MMKKETKSIICIVVMCAAGISIGLLSGDVQRTDDIIPNDLIIPIYLLVLVFIVFTILLLRYTFKLVKEDENIEQG